ncbi:hypothetical protein F4810DRAFT_684243 [Camillea tinctor]|nr:hypothetical protein F4810DRAFT_684243 [Camillea tinctor]
MKHPILSVWTTTRPLTWSWETGVPVSKFDVRSLVAQLPHNNTDEKIVWPLSQLANACKIAQTRYGYIQTEEHMIVCRFSIHNREIWNVALMPIPWTCYGADKLTTDLALWWLGMLAMSDSRHRTIVREEEMVRINAWEETKLPDGSLLRRHQYSNIQRLVDPPSPRDNGGDLVVAPDANFWSALNPSFVAAYQTLGSHIEPGNTHESEFYDSGENYPSSWVNEAQGN